MKKFLAAFPFILSLSILVHAQKKLVVQADRPGPAISRTMWGIFFEDINFGADGGLYAELVKNRSFEFPMPMMGWKEVKYNATGKVLVVNAEKENPANPRFAQIRAEAAQGGYGISNEGFRGIGIQANTSYVFSMRARKTGGEPTVQVQLYSSLGKKIGVASFAGLGKEWKNYQMEIRTVDSAVRGRLELLLAGTGSIDVDLISLFPKNTWKNRPNGLRADLVQLLADLKPGFVRFPGGCIVEGRDLSNRYQWKTTVGLPEERKLIMNRWNVEFPRRSAPDYYQTFGLGFYEYFLLSEDIGAEPLPIINCGMACQFNSSEVASMNELGPYIQDALDLIEFANGSVQTRWGKLRADMGHPEPFQLKYLGVGNEQWDEQYIDRYKEFEKILKQKYPDIKLVAAAGPSPDGPRFDYAWKQLRSLSADLVDEHYYQSPEWFLKNASRYDQYERKGPKVFAGEYAAHGKEESKAESKNTWLSALAEAAFMTGLERNADIVQMASYAPLLAHVDAWQWRPDLIWFDNLKAVPTPNYFVQQFFSANRGDRVIPLLLEGKVINGQDSLYGSSVIEGSTLILKLVNAGGVVQPADIMVSGKKVSGKEAVTQQLTATDLFAYNSVEAPARIRPVEGSLALKKDRVQIQLPAYSVTVIRIPVKK
jgi:alpha-N-arabinofuranosidase